ncbi:MAG: hypothetical protein GY769_11835, partial [bacterium]|nr:hypothetical protein [bacterium]
MATSYLNFEGTESTGHLRLHLGVGERRGPLSPDTIVLPAVVNALPVAVVESALRVLGQGWSVATAPTGTLPEGVTRVTKSVILGRATELSEAGFRAPVGEPLAQALTGLALSWVGTGEAGFEQILRETSAGEEFRDAIGSSLTASTTVAEFQRELSDAFTSFPPHLLIGVGSGLGEAPIEWEVEDASGRRLDTAGVSDLTHAGFIPLAGTGRGLALVGSLGSSLYDVGFTATETGELDLSVSLPLPDGKTGFFVFPGVSLDPGVLGRLEIDLLQSSSTLTLFIDRNGDGIFEESVESAPVEVLVASGARLLAATAIGPETLSGADPWGR